MKKRNLMPVAKKTAKSAFALSLAATMIMPAGVGVAAAEGDSADDTTTVTVPAPIKTYDFNGGLQELKDEDDNFQITSSEELYFQKSEEEGAGDRLDANGLVYMGSGSETRYYKGTISNQPTTAYDEEKGTVLKIGKTQTIPAIYKSKSAFATKDDGSEDVEGTAALDKELPYTASGAAASAEGVLVQPEKTISSEIVISNPFAAEGLRESLVERDEYAIPDDTWVRYRGSRYQPVWNKGLTLSYWINVPSDEQGLYKPSSVLRWELLDQTYYQADDYAKYLGCKYFDVEFENMGYSEDQKAELKKEESKRAYGSEYYFKYEDVKEGETDADGAPVAELQVGSAGFAGPVYDSRYCNGEDGAKKSRYYQFNPNFIRGYYRMADGSLQAQLSELVGSADANCYSQYKTLDIEEGSWVRKADDVDGELQIDVDNSIFWVADNNLGHNSNPNVSASYGTQSGMQNGDRFFMNSWQEGSEKDVHGNGTYQSAKNVAVSPVTSLDENGKGVKNGNCDTWHQVTVTLQNDWVEFYVDGVKADVDNNYSSRGLISLPTTEEFKRLNKGTGLRYGYGSEKGAIDFSYGNYVCRLLMDWITDEEATLHIGGAGQYAPEYAQATTSCEFSLDDLKFYGELLTEEQIVAAYNQEAADMSAENDLTKASMLDLTAVTNVSVGEASADAVKTEKVTIEGKEFDSVSVAKNERQTTATGAKTSNPFAGKDIEGATLAYWVKQEDAERASVLSFIDGEKNISDLKGHSGKAQSILYVKNDGEASFIEGYSNGALVTGLSNTCVTAADATAAAALLEKTNQKWSYVTVTMNNSGIKYYVDGEIVSNQAADTTGPRFLDGYYQRLKDEADVKIRYGIFGGTNNQCATPLMSFLTAEDTELYLGYYPLKDNMGANRTSDVAFAGIKALDTDLTAEEVKTLYENRFNENGSSTIKPGDVNGDEKVDLTDASTVLKAALKITTLEGDAAKAADVNNDGKIDLTDASLVLKLALKIISQIPSAS